MTAKKTFWRAFLDFFVLFSGVSTKSNISRTRKAPVEGRGMFLFRKDDPATKPDSRQKPVRSR